MRIALDSKLIQKEVSSIVSYDFNQLLDTHHQQLYWMIRKIVVSHDDTEDILQNTWIKIYKGLPKFEGKSALSTWMFRIAYNESMRFLKRKKTPLRIDDLDNNYLNEIHADTYYSGNDAADKLHKALSELSTRERLIFNFKYFDEMKFNEIASLLEMNENSVKTVYYKAEKTIKTVLKNDL